MTENEASAIITGLKAEGWEFRGGYGKVCGFGKTLWGSSYGRNEGEFITFDYTEDDSSKTVKVEMHRH